MPFSPKSQRSAFTLIELLVVLGVMAIFIGVFATALRPGSPTVVVEGAQSQLASLLTQARGVAILKGAETRLIIHADPTNPERYLRFAGIVYWDDKNENGEMDDDEWVPAMDGITLPKSVYAYVHDDDDSPANLETGFVLEYISNNPEEYDYIRFYPNGTVPDINSNSPILAISSGEGVPGEEPVRNEKTNRGAIVRQYGSFVLLNEEEAFPSE